MSALAVPQTSPPQIEVRGRVTSGRGWATPELLAFHHELRTIVREPLCPGSLNVVLEGPLRLSPDAGFAFGGGEKMVWRASFQDLDVWLYRWQDAPLHIVELLCPIHLKSTFGFRDGDKVSIQLSESQVRPIGPVGRFVWSLVWLGRRRTFYEDGIYYYLASRGIHVVWLAKKVTTSLKQVLKQTPVVNTVARKLWSFLRGRGTASDKYTFSRLSLASSAGDDRRIAQLQNVLNFTKTSGSSYSAQQFAAGYHTITIGTQTLAGQRDPAKRLASVPFDFHGKTLLDIGCNQGGMIHVVKDAVKWAVGVDYDPRMINAANKIKSLYKAENTSFYVLDLESDPLDLISDLLPEEKVDICFLLAVCMWLRNWKEVIDFAQRKSDAMLFETNGTIQQQSQQVEFLRTLYEDVTILREASDDDPVQRNRKLLYLTKPLQRRAHGFKETLLGSAASLRTASADPVSHS